MAEQVIEILKKKKFIKKTVKPYIVKFYYITILRYH